MSYLFKPSRQINGRVFVELFVIRFNARPNSTKTAYITADYAHHTLGCTHKHGRQQELFHRGKNILGGKNFKLMSQGKMKVLKTRIELLKVLIFWYVLLF